ncbi:MAG: HTH domain-containing protein [Candidatus Korarchaeota archaeon]
MGIKMKLEEIFKTNLQTRLLEIFLENPNELFSIRALAEKLSTSPSSVIPRLKALKELGVIKETGTNRLKLYQLNRNRLTEALVSFYRQIKSL